jgi:hypothetical protein
MLSPFGNVWYGAAHPFQSAGALLFRNWTTASVAVSVSGTPLQVPLQVDEEVAPPASNEAVEPAGGRTSTKVTANVEPEFPESVMLKFVEFAVPPNA